MVPNDVENVMEQKDERWTMAILRQQKLDKASLHIRACADASFATNYDNSSRLGYIILLANKHDNSNIINYIRHKNSRVTRSLLRVVM